MGMLRTKERMDELERIKTIARTRMIDGLKSIPRKDAVVKTGLASEEISVIIHHPFSRSITLDKMIMVLYALGHDIIFAVD